MDATRPPDSADGSGEPVASAVGRSSWRPAAMHAVGRLLSRTALRHYRFADRALGLTEWCRRLSLRAHPWVGHPPLTLDAGQLPGAWPPIRTATSAPSAVPPGGAAPPDGETALGVGRSTSHPAADQPRSPDKPAASPSEEGRHTPDMTSRPPVRLAVLPLEAPRQTRAEGTDSVGALPAPFTHEGGHQRLDPAFISARLTLHSGRLRPAHAEPQSQARSAPSQTRLRPSASPQPRREVRPDTPPSPRPVISPSEASDAEPTRTFPAEVDYQPDAPPETAASPWTAEGPVSADPGVGMPSVVERVIERLGGPGSLPGLTVRVPAPLSQPVVEQPAPPPEPPAPAAEALRVPEPGPEVDVAGLADKVYELLQRRQRVERERRGLY